MLDWKGKKLKNTIILLAVLSAIMISGCQGPSGKGSYFLALNFKPEQSLSYKFISDRIVTLDWNTNQKTRQSQGTIVKGNERLEMVVTYTVENLDPNGVAKIRGECKSAVVTRKGDLFRKKGTDAAQSFVGKSFTFKVDATGKIRDYSDMKRVFFETGENAFRKSSRPGRVKEQDMVADIVATQWFLWDPEASITDPLSGVIPGDSWNSAVSVPTPIIVKEARDVQYDFVEVRDTDTGRVALIKSTYSPSSLENKDWPIPYEGKFNVSGTFGFLTTFTSGFEVLELTGDGYEYFNIDKGLTEKRTQNYVITMQSTSRSMMGTKPIVSLKQHLMMSLLTK